MNLFRPDRYIPAALAVVATFIFISGIIPWQTSWGINHLQYFQKPAGIIFIVLTAIIIIPATGRLLFSCIQKITGHFNKLADRYRIGIVILLSLIAFYTLRVKVHALGDGYLRVYHLEQGYFYNNTEPLDFFVHAVIYNILNPVLGISAESIYMSISIVCGALFVYFLFRSHIITGSERHILTKVLALSFAGSLLFFGYVESYSLVYVFALLYILAAWRFLGTGHGFCATTLLFAGAISSHLSGLILFPSYIILLYRFYGNEPAETMRFRHFPLLLISAAAIILASLDYYDWLKNAPLRPGFADLLLPLIANDDYGIFSPAHLRDILNQFLLVCPVALILLPYLFMRQAAIPKSISRNLFFCGLVAGALLFIFMIDPKLGFARDWDLFAMPTAVIGLAIILTVYEIRTNHLSTLLWRFTIPAMAILLTALWIITNASENRQLLRAEKVLELSPRGRGYGLELLAHHYSEIKGDARKALQLFREIDGPARNNRVLYKISRLEFNLHDYHKSLEATREGLILDSTDQKLHAMAGASLIRLEKPAEALPHLKSAASGMADEPQIYSYLGGAYLRLDSLPQAMNAYETLIRLDPNNPVGYFHIGYIYLKFGALDSARYNFEKCLRLDPTFPDALDLLEKVKN